MVEAIDIIHKLITIRVYMDTELPKAKQLLTNWIKDLENDIKRDQ